MWLGLEKLKKYYPKFHNPGRKDLCEFIGITIHKYKKGFGNFETKLFKNFLIQKKQIN